jgi:hypothetical protein
MTAVPCVACIIIKGSRFKVQGSRFKVQGSTVQRFNVILMKIERFEDIYFKKYEELKSTNPEP